MATIMRVGGGAGGGEKAKTIASLNVGDIVQMRENGVFAQYRIVHKGLPSAMYDASCDGVWLMREKLYETRQWDSADNSYKDSTVQEYLSNTFAEKFTSKAKNLIKTVKIPYISGKGNSPVASGANGLEAKVFLLGAYEVGFTKTTNSGITEDGACLNYFSGAGNSKRIAYLNGTATKWWLRSSFTAYEAYTWLVGADGGCSYDGILNVYGIRPAFILSNGAEIADEPNADGSYSLLCDAVQDEVGQLGTGDTMLITENGIPTEYYIAKHGYEPTLNNNRTLLVRKEAHSSRVANSSGINTYADSTIDTWLNSDFFNSLSSGVRELLDATKFPYTPGYNNNTVTTLERAVFLLSLTEVGGTHGGANVEGSALPIASVLRIAYLNGTAVRQFTRSPYKDTSFKYFMVMTTAGESNVALVTESCGIRPVFTIPSDAKVVGPDNIGRYTLEVDYVPDVYGIARDITASSPEWVRTDGAMTFSATASIGTVAGASDFDNIYPWSEMKRVTLDSGDVMVRIPKFYYGRYRNGNIERIQISGRADVGLSLHPAFNHGGVEADCIYVGAYKASDNGSWMCSVSGVAPKVNLRRDQFRSVCKNKAQGWYMMDISTLSAIQMLYLVEFANNNSQAMIGRGYVDGNSAAIKTGTCDVVPNLTGRPAGTDGKTDIVYRGIEGLWGNIWEFVDGYNWNGGNQYVCNDPSKYADDTMTGYTEFSHPNAYWSGGYITTTGLDNTGVNPHIMLPSAAGSGSESTYYCDAVWSASGWRTYAHGGSWDYASVCGLFATGLDNASSYSHPANGSRLIYIPQ